MAEPKIEHFFAVLKHRDFSVGSLASQIDDLAEFLHYVDPVRADSVVEAIEKQSEDDRMQLIKSLACSYPLSQHIVARILKRIKGSDADFISEFDIQEIVLKSLRSNFDVFSAGMRRLTQQTNEYNDGIKELESKLEEYKTSADALKDLRKQRDKLQADVTRMEQEANADSLNKAIEDLEREKDQLEDKIREKNDKKKQLDSSIANLKKELSASKEKMETDEERKMLRELFKKFPIDAED